MLLGIFLGMAPLYTPGLEARRPSRVRRWCDSFRVTCIKHYPDDVLPGREDTRATTRPGNIASG